MTIMYTTCINIHVCVVTIVTSVHRFVHTLTNKYMYTVFRQRLKTSFEVSLAKETMLITLLYTNKRITVTMATSNSNIQYCDSVLQYNIAF